MFSPKDLKNGVVPVLVPLFILPNFTSLPYFKQDKNKHNFYVYCLFTLLQNKYKALLGIQKITYFIIPSLVSWVQNTE